MKKGTFLLYSRLSPKLFFSSIFHPALAFGTGFHIPDTDVVAAALQTQASNLASVGRCHVGNDTTHYDILDGLAVGTRHCCDLLAKQSTTFVHIGLIAAVLTAIFPFPSHLTILICYPITTSSTIIRTKPTAKPMVLRLLC